MDSTQTSQLKMDDQPSEQITESREVKEFSVERIQALVTPEQEFSDSVARKRRSFTKKRTTGHPVKDREQTPVRYLPGDKSTSDEEPVPIFRPKTPERKRRKVRRLASAAAASSASKSEPETEEQVNVKSSNGVRRSKSIPKHHKLPESLVQKLPSSRQDINQKLPSNTLIIDKIAPVSNIRTSSVPKYPVPRAPTPSYTVDRRDSLESLKDIAQLAQNEVKAFFHKTKKQLSEATNRGRDRFKKDKQKVKRSQSAPYAFSEEELIESFRRAQLLNGIYSDISKNPPRKYSDASATASTRSVRSSTPEKVADKRELIHLEIRPEAKEFLRQRKKPRIVSNKIIEILDPATSKVVATQRVLAQPQKVEYKLSQLFAIFRMYSILEIVKQFRHFKKEMKEDCLKIKILRNRCIAQLFVLIIYLGIGAYIFKFTEGHFENFYKCGVRRVKRDFIDQLWMRSHNLREEDWKSLARNKLRNFEEELHTAHEAGIKTYSGQRSWSFLNGIVYATSVITTIGYGHLSPTTVTGKILTIFYSVIGIPLFLIAMTDFGKLFTRCIKFFWSYVRRLYYTGSCRKVRKTAHMKEIMKGAQLMYDIATFRRPSAISNPDESQPQDPNGAPKTTSTLSKTPGSTPTTPAISTFEVDDEFNLPVTLAIFILLLYLIMGALLYCNYIENNSFFDAFYFVFISMSTIGFGDIVPRSSVVMNVSLVYLVFGLALMSMCINVVQDKLSDTFKQASAKLGATIGLRMDDGSVTVVEMPDVHGEMPGVHIGEVADAKEEGRNVTGNFLEVQQEKLGEEKVKRMESERDEKVGSENGEKRKSGEVIVEKVGES